MLLFFWKMHTPQPFLFFWKTASPYVSAFLFWTQNLVITFLSTVFLTLMSFEVRPNQHSFLEGESPDYLIHLLSVPLCGCLYLIRGLDVPLESLGLTPSRPYEPKVLVVLFQPVVQSMSKSQDHANEALWRQVYVSGSWLEFWRVQIFQTWAVLQQLNLQH